MTETCDTCRCYDRTEGKCRRRAPAIITLFNVKAGSYGDTPIYESKPWSGWPLVTKYDWCEEWQPMAAKEPS